MASGSSQLDDALTTVVVVNYNAGEHLSACVDSVLAQDAPLELLVVDNASRDNSLQALVAHAGDRRLRIMRNDSNRGYAGACNQGAAAGRGALLCLLNPDARLPPNALAQVGDILGREPGVALAGVNVVDGAGQPMRATWRRLPTPWRSLVTFSGLERLGVSGVNLRPPADPPGVWPCEAVSGACLFIRREWWRRMDGLDQGYFLHCEDLDLFKRLREAGQGIALLTRIQVIHEGGVSSSRQPLKVAWHKHRGMLRYFMRHHGAHGLNPMVWLVGLAISLRLLMLAPLLALRGHRARRH